MESISSVPARLVLASTSRYRRQLLERLGLPFETVAPEIGESPLQGERPEATALRLSIAKATSVGCRFPNALVIGADQVAELDGKPIGKPGTHELAVLQLRAMRERTVQFHSGLCLSAGAEQPCQSCVVRIDVSYRDFSDQQIERYLLAERPYDCAGSAKIEGLGISLIRSVSCNDPTALVGLPLVSLIRMLGNVGVEVP